MGKAILVVLASGLGLYAALKLLVLLITQSCGSSLVSWQIPDNFWTVMGVGGAIGAVLVVANCLGPWPRLAWRRILIAYAVTTLGYVLTIFLLLRAIMAPTPARRYHYYYFSPEVEFSSGFELVGITIYFLPFIGLMLWVIWRRSRRSSGFPRSRE